MLAKQLDCVFQPLAFEEGMNEVVARAIIRGSLPEFISPLVDLANDLVYDLIQVAFGVCMEVSLDDERHRGANISYHCHIYLGWWANRALRRFAHAL